MAHAACITKLHTPVQHNSTDLVQFFWNGPIMETVGQRLRALRDRTPHTVRSVAKFIGFENHSRYSYYESPRFKKPLPLDLARQLAELFYRSGKVEMHEVLSLAGLSEAEALTEEKQMIDDRRPPTRPNIISMQVRLPNEEALTEMFGGMLEAVGRQDLSAALAGQLAQLLPTALSVTPIEVPAGGSSPEDRVHAVHLLQDALSLIHI